MDDWFWDRAIWGILTVCMVLSLVLLVLVVLEIISIFVSPWELPAGCHAVYHHGVYCDPVH